jgi:hypothetical protein
MNDSKAVFYYQDESPVIAHGYFGIEAQLGEAKEGSLYFENNKLHYVNKVYLLKLDLFAFNFAKSYLTNLSKKTSIKKGPLAQALGLTKNNFSSIWDCTGGQLKDTLLFSTHKFKITVFERELLLANLIHDGLRIAKLHNDPQVASHFSKNINFIFGNPNDLYPNGIIEAECPDILYYDPMYLDAGKGKSAPKKGMQIIKKLYAQKDTIDSQTDFLNWALKTKVKRVVVKRPIKGATIPSDFPITDSFKGTTTRYDLYCPAR